MGLFLAYLNAALSSSWLWLVVLSVTLYWIYMRVLVIYYDTSIDRTDDKTFLVTGAETGIGREIADLLASRGGHIIMACKDVKMGQTARAWGSKIPTYFNSRGSIALAYGMERMTEEVGIEWESAKLKLLGSQTQGSKPADIKVPVNFDQIISRTRNDRVEVHHLDLSSLQSVRHFSKQIHSTVDKLDVLVNNAAIACASSDKTADGLNTIMQVNHFGPFLLSNLLLDLMKKAGRSRIVFVSCVSHHLHKFSLDNLNCEKEPLPDCRLYFNSKLANILTAKYFARILQGTGVCVNTVHPGFTNSNLTTNCSGSILSMLYNLWISIFGRLPREGAMTPVYAATEPTLAYVTGAHFFECKVSNCVAKIAADTIVQERLFEKSSQLVKLRPEETHI